VDDLDDAAFVRAFEAAELPREAWTHRAHLRTAYLHLASAPFAEALERIRRGIRTLNAAHETPESLTRGYHETLTQAWLRLVAADIGRDGPGADSRAFLKRQVRLGRPGLIDVHYSRERLFSAEAKAGFVEPDRAPLP
jgi:hypothetical protein